MGYNFGLNDITPRFRLGFTGSAPPWFIHKPAPGKPSPPAMPGFCPAIAADEVNDWLQMNGNPYSRIITPEPKHSHALAKVAEYRAYYRSPAYIAWCHKDMEDRESQYRYFQAEVHLDNYPSIPISADPSGLGTPSTTGYCPYSY